MTRVAHFGQDAHAAATVGLGKKDFASAVDRQDVFIREAGSFGDAFHFFEGIGAILLDGCFKTFGDCLSIGPFHSGIVF